MTFVESLDANSTVRDILLLNPEAGKALMRYHLAVLRQPSSLTEGERELIAAYVSALNNCQFCYGAHAVAAQAFGVPEDTLDKLVLDVDGAPIADKLKPVLRFARKLTLKPATMVQADADAVFAVGWTEQALHDAICVTCLYNFMNRLLDGHGVRGHNQLYQHLGQRLHERGYAPTLHYLEGR